MALKSSLFNPQVTINQHIDVFKKLVLKALDSLKLKPKSDPGYIKKGIKLLTQRKDIVIRPADKGGAVVVQSKQQYKDELDRQLQDADTYCKLLGNPLWKYKKEVQRVINLGVKKGILNKKGGQISNS